MSLLSPDQLRALADLIKPSGEQQSDEDDELEVRKICNVFG